jgi:hypothetical protein
MEAINQQINLQVNNELLSTKWAMFVMEKWVKALVKYKVGVTHDLQRSFEKELIKSNGNVDRVIFKFLKYGRFPDMGVGSGWDLNGLVEHRRFDRYRDTRGTMTESAPRRKKPWYSKTFFKEVAKLKAIYQEEYGQQLINVLESALTGTMNLPH